ncbi:transcriptional regulator NrdR [Limnochorda pilosa]|uniref:Transcriptional repressor NrdR n=1 Tax=Limnochorda pilosa TaxID=1555112 RepID=A0A0K2SKR5_LIMPI|nr:transcriptional regulator NrdR [Limnochorda pilosa]BAS27696.1 NrdR family transcriptional regulator [Limnochorda pilosa]
MRCPYCGKPDSRVLDSRGTDEGHSIRRRRECEACGRRFTTYERWEEGPLVVVKKDGRRERFQRGKILTGLLKACEKRPLTAEQLDGVASEIERELRTQYDREIPSQVIGEMVMDRLRKLDAVAYVRFASVYREFADVGRFREALDQLLGEG